MEAAAFSLSAVDHGLDDSAIASITIKGGTMNPKISKLKAERAKNDGKIAML